MLRQPKSPHSLSRAALNRKEGVNSHLEMPPMAHKRRGKRCSSLPGNGSGSAGGLLLVFACSFLLNLCFATPQPVIPSSPSNSFSFQSALLGVPQSLSLNIESNNPAARTVRINGYDSRRPGTPFTWRWGDGSTTTGWFPQTHVYPSAQSNYVVTVTHSYADGMQKAETIVWFTSPRLQPVQLPSDTVVSIPTSPQALTTRLYPVPTSLTNFGPASFGFVPQPTIEYVLSAAAAVQRDFANENFFRPDGQFRQVVLCDPNAGGSLYSVWFTSPAAFSAGPTAFSGTLGWSSFFHEMGHNFSLNSPAEFYFGGRIDGNANAIVSEALAQIFQHATGYELINHGAELGFGADLTADIRNSVLASIQIVRSSYSNYLNSGSVFRTWNDPNTSPDDAFDTFMTIAYKFLEHAELAGQGYRAPLKRLMQSLQLFNDTWKTRYAQNENSSAADTFRATLWVAALSHAFQSDLRAEFKALNFPVDDSTFSALSSEMAALPDIASPPHQLSVQFQPDYGACVSISGPTPRFYAIQVCTNLSTPAWTTSGNVFNSTSNSLWFDPAARGNTRFHRSLLLP